MTEENLTPYIPIGTLFKYLLKDYRRERQRTIHMEAQVTRWSSSGMRMPD